MAYGASNKEVARSTADAPNVRSDGIIVNWFVDHSWQLFTLAIAIALGVEAIAKTRVLIGGQSQASRLEVALLGVSAVAIGWQSVATLLAR